jgi:hypothetical protein
MHRTNLKTKTLISAVPMMGKTERRPIIRLQGHMPVPAAPGLLPSPSSLPAGHCRVLAGLDGARTA